MFSYETKDDESGVVTGYHYLNGDPGVRVDGGFGFTDEEGRSYDLTFEADENGYRPSADFLPQAPEEPEEIREARANFYSLWEAIAAEHQALREEAGEEDGGGEGVITFDDGGDQIDLRGGSADVSEKRRKRQALPVLPIFSYRYPAAVPVQQQHPVALYPGVPTLLHPYQPAVVFQGTPFRVFGPPGNQQPQKGKQHSPVKNPPAIPNVPEADESGVAAL